MAKVRVGVKRIKDGEVALAGSPADMAFQQHWIEIDGHRLDGNAIRRIQWGPIDPREAWGEQVVTLVLACSDFETVDCNTPAAEPA